MLIGAPKEIKNHEYRAGLTPAAVRQLVATGHSVLVERDLGAAIGLTNQAYQAAGASVVESAAEIFATAEMIVKVKEPQPQECRMLRPDQVLFTYLHLAPDPGQTRLLLDSGAIAIAYEAMLDDPHLRNGLNVFRGKLTHGALHPAAGQQYLAAEQALAA